MLTFIARFLHISNNKLPAINSWHKKEKNNIKVSFAQEVNVLISDADG